MNRRIFLILVGLAVTRAADAAPLVSMFSELPAGEELHVRFHSEGCFHWRTWTFRFFREPELKAAVTRITMKPDPVTQKLSSELGTLTLTPDEIAGLDRLLNYYRGQSSSGWTTVEAIKFTQIRRATVVSTESYVDRASPQDIAEITTLMGLGRKAERLPMRPEHSRPTPE